jgi:hypothetical protein
VIEVLGGLGDLGLGLNRLLERAHSGVGGDLEGEEVGIYMRGCGDGQCDPPVGTRNVSPFLRTTRHGRAARTWSIRLEATPQLPAYRLRNASGCRGAAYGGSRRAEKSKRPDRMAEKWEKLSRREDADRCKKGKEKQNEDGKEKNPAISEGIG